MWQFIWVRNHFLTQATYPGLYGQTTKPCLVFLLVGFAFATSITAGAVSSYLAISPLFGFCPNGIISVALSRSCDLLLLGATMSAGARTFLPEISG